MKKFQSKQQPRKKKICQKEQKSISKKLQTQLFLAMKNKIAYAVFTKTDSGKDFLVKGNFGDDEHSADDLYFARHELTALLNADLSWKPRQRKLFRRDPREPTFEECLIPGREQYIRIGIA